ncbi:hypothetical protein GF339_04905 [candidate division KSB3 bacterium]|uniref:Uncharacterized protein n=1 Tax=candidate division KSB3 bacterium TaxID=2044937 RepID=A0A9D5JTI3_9BACT|nr:hypothetical protein [candidate division KSB3 bacterium]MBD3323900.1 hypothetical protein [candidate division KSB3 bacterium]
MALLLWGCEGKTVNPTAPEANTPSPSPVPTNPDVPEADPTPVEESQSCDNFAENPDDPDLPSVEVDGETYTVNMECTGDIDWYKIRVASFASASLTIVLTDIPDKSDFDLVVYDAELQEFADGRSARSGNVEERLSVTIEQEPFIYLQIYSYSGRGKARLSVTAEDAEDSEDSEGVEEPQDSEDAEDSEETEIEIDQLSYEDVLDQELVRYPRGTSFGLLERSVEVVTVESIRCQLADTELEGEFTIGNYAHVERELLELVDYIDGWALVVFNGSQPLLDRLTVQIAITIVAPDLELDVTAPDDMEVEGDTYLTDDTQSDVYYASQAYGDFLGNTQRDIRISSGVVGDLGDLFSNDIFTQQVNVEWRFEDEDGTICSGTVEADPIVDFESAKFFFLDQY